jgi:hypothetical protein
MVAFVIFIQTLPAVLSNEVNQSCLLGHLANKRVHQW